MEKRRYKEYRNTMLYFVEELTEREFDLIGDFGWAFLDVLQLFGT